MGCNRELYCVPWSVHLLGLVSLACIALSGWSLIQEWQNADTQQMNLSNQRIVGSVVPTKVVREIAVEHGRKLSEPSHYPLELGRYWVYNSSQGAVKAVERAISRVEEQGGRRVYVFADSSVAYREGDMVFEVEGSGGLNVVPLGMRPNQPYVYRSQGLHIEKWIASPDTLVIVDGHPFAACVEVVTRFHSIQEDDQEMRVYSSYYAPGIGLVGREQWPRPSPYGPGITLKDYGVRSF